MSGPGAQPVVSNLMTHAFTTFYHGHHLQVLLNGLYLNAPDPNTRFGVRICALAIASVTERTCVLSIIPAITITIITQGIRTGGMQIDIFASFGQITAAARFSLDLRVASGRSSY